LPISCPSIFLSIQLEIIMKFSKTPSLLASIAAACAALAAPSVHAQAFDAVRLYGAAPGKDGGLVGGAVLAGTQYQGSDKRRTQVHLLLDYQWANGWFAGTTNGIGYNFSASRSLQYGLRITGDLGRKESRSSALRGMGDVDAKAEAGGFFNVALTPEFSITSSLRYGAGQDGKGLVADLGGAYSTSIAAQWRLSAGAGVSAANAEYMQSFFGVTAAQAAASGYSAYAPESGVRNGKVSLGLTYMASPRVSVTGGISANTLLGDAADSPLVRKKTSAVGLLAAAYAF
jgi:outer membrane scaffolding protein for murein synthesis (MipA/OmpV family)